MTSLAEQRSQSAVQLQLLHISTGAKPRRLMNTRLCSPRFTVASIALSRSCDKPSISGALRVSIYSISAGIALAGRGGLSEPQLPLAAPWKKFSAGVGGPPPTEK